MSLDNNSANNFKDFLNAIKPYLNYQPVDLSCMGIDAFQFSTDEKPVGMWTDRKILYAKTLSGTTKSGKWSSVEHGISNLGTVVHMQAVVNNGTTEFTVINGYSSSETSGNVSCNATVASVFTGSSLANKPFYVTLLYTKTTDSPLSADEKFAGVTSGGDVIYERTYTYGSTLTASSTPQTINLIDISGVDIGNMIDISGIMTWGTSSYNVIPYMRIGPNNYGIDVNCFVSSQKDYIQMSLWRSEGTTTVSDITVTIRYTKTQ